MKVIRSHRPLGMRCQRPTTRRNFQSKVMTRRFLRSPFRTSAPATIGKPVHEPLLIELNRHNVNTTQKRRTGHL